ncbi:MAG: metal-dependent hydrolase [Pseudomonadota bacterium]
MDNLTHSLAGAVLGQLGLKKKTGLGMATLIIAANIPDIDAFATLLGGQQHLALRRGFTHGPIALLILPILLTGIMIWFDRWQTKRGKRPEDRLPVHRGWLLGLAYIGTLSHPALDWLNSYGIRLLEPWSSQWVYGDTIFIIDIWIWAALITGVWISRRREKQGGNWQRPAWITFAAISAYIFANGLITGRAESHGHELVEKAYNIQPDQVVANPVPVKFWERQLLWRLQSGDQTAALFGDGYYSLFAGPSLYQRPGNASAPPMILKPGGLAAANKAAIRRNDPAVVAAVDEAAKDNKDLKAFLFWSRMPIMERTGDEIRISDQRFDDPLVGDRFAVRIPYPKDRLERSGE